ncbi:MAG: DNA replication/repair protein RecF [Qingshengfaniella sp.]
MATFIDTLSLSRFRSHKRVDLRFDGRPVAIFGPNGAGKTNLVEAISLLSPGRGLRGATAADLCQRPDPLGWKIEAHLHLDQGPRRHEISLQADAHGTRSCRIDGKPAPRTALGTLLRVLWLVPSMDRLWIEGAEGRRRFLDRLALGFHPDHAEHSLAYERAMRARNRLLKDHSGDRRWYGALELQMAEAGVQIMANRADTLDRLAQAQTNAATSFPAADLTLQGSQDAEGAAGTPDVAALADLLARSRSADLRAGRSLSGPHRTDLLAHYREKSMPAAQCSTGEQKALLISLLLATARALVHDQAAAPILLLDEVAAHLDARRRASLYDEIVALGSQAFLTGTGPELFAEFGSRASYLSVTEETGHSAIAPFTTVPDQ